MVWVIPGQVVPTSTIVFSETRGTCWGAPGSGEAGILQAAERFRVASQLLQEGAAAWSRGSSQGPTGHAGTSGGIGRNQR